MIHEINYKYDHKRLYNEAIYADGYVSFNDPLTKKDIPEWCISKTIGPYGLSIVKDFSNICDCEIRPRYYIQEKGFTLPFHTDRGTQCAINFVLSTSKDPIRFKTESGINSYQYRTAIVDVTKEHEVRASKEDRYLFKLSIFDKSYEDVLENINRSLITS